MSRRLRAPFLAVLSFSVFAGVGPLVAAPAHAQAPADPTTPTPAPVAKAYVVVDADRGVVLAAANHHEPLLIASLSKVMTAFVTLEQLQLSYEIEVTPLAASQPAMRIGMQPGQRWKLADALSSLMLVSANDAAYAMAEAAAGSVEEFSSLMQRTAERLGMKDSQWLDPAGLDGDEGYGGGTKASAYDLAIVARNALRVPEIAAAAGLANHEFVGGDGINHTLRNHNKMLTTFPGATGLKTGYTKAAGHTLIASAEREGRHLIAVVIGAPNHYDVAATLFEQGFATPTSTKGTGEAMPPTSFTRAKAPAVTPARAEGEAGAASESAGLLGSLRRPAGVVLVFLVVAFFGRREQIKRRKRRRAMMRRAYLDAKRRGMIDVIDAERYYGRSRSGAAVAGMRPEDDLWPPREMRDPAGPREHRPGHAAHRRGHRTTRH